MHRAHSFGNFGRKTYEAPFRPSEVSQTIQGHTVELHDFDPGPGVDTCQQITVYDEDSLLAGIGRRAALSDEDFAAFAQRDRTPAQPVSLE